MDDYDYPQGLYNAKNDYTISLFKTHFGDILSPDWFKKVLSVTVPLSEINESAYDDAKVEVLLPSVNTKINIMRKILNVFGI